MTSEISQRALKTSEVMCYDLHHIYSPLGVEAIHLGVI